MDQDMRQKAARTAVDGFKAVERIYRHAFQTLNALKGKIRTDNNLKLESVVINSSQSSVEPASWIHQFKGIYLAHQKFTFEEYKKEEPPILFIQASLYHHNGKEPLLRYGLVKRIYQFVPFKGARFDDYFKEIMAELHAEPNLPNIKTPRCKGIVEFDEKLLLDIREESDVVSLADHISDKYVPFLIQ